MTATCTRRAWIAGLLLALSAGSVSPSAPARADEPVVVFAAAGRKNARDEASAAWGRATGRAALTKASRNADGATFPSSLRSPAARPFFERQGFVAIGTEKRS